MSERIRIVLADDHTIFRSGLKALLATEPDMEVIGEAGDGRQAVERCVQLGPDVLVLDLKMPGVTGLEVLPELRQRCPACRALILTMLPEEQYLLQVLRAGGLGYVPKSAADTELTDAIRGVYRGEVYVRPQDARLLLADFLRGDKAGQDALDTLSAREREVLDLVVRGFSSRAIGERLALSPKTVDTYRQRLMEKLGLGSRVELVEFAVRKGLLQP
ncbi:MAG: response regulator [Chloroflexota bacterium]